MSTKIQTEEGDVKNYGGVTALDQVSDIGSVSPPKFRKAVYISAIVAAVGGFVCGYDTGAVSGILAMPLFQAAFFTPDNIVYLQGLLLALYLMTAALGAFFSGFFCGKCFLVLLCFCLFVRYSFVYANFRSIQ